MTAMKLMHVYTINVNMANGCSYSNLYESSQNIQIYGIIALDFCSTGTYSNKEIEVIHVLVVNHVLLLMVFFGVCKSVMSLECTSKIVGVYLKGH